VVPRLPAPRAQASGGQVRMVLRSSAIALAAAAFFFALPAWAAELFLLPQNSLVGRGETFFVEVRLDTEGEDINAVEANLVFPQTYLEVVTLDRGGSILTLWPREPAFSNTEGTLSFSGGTQTGFSGHDGLVGRILSLSCKRIRGCRCRDIAGFFPGTPQ